MNTNIEEPAKAAIRRLQSQGWSGSATASEWQAIGVWFAKTLLLSLHPSARYSLELVDQKWDRHLPWQPPVSWLSADPIAIPDDVSVYLHRVDLAQNPTLAAPRRYYVPAIADPDNPGERQIAALTKSTDGIGVSLLVHPGWAMDNPMVGDSEAIDALRGGVSRDLAAFPPFGPGSIGWLATSAQLKQRNKLGALEPWKLTTNLFAPLLERNDLASWWQFQV
ncbi:hypothetical protein [Pseudoclavibacter sp. VKM Ac-2888]|uniref:hypothetical protein n=1 Tax=Pseudoclavibacter sp. VKM Ac-2888 TaxID=2783830 RepID=UPI00188A8153|nr:hypothetical protein [Pseudoclavibacter sp. VKM Ac-2888]MBF4549314.1 hypothetical protein [Pseudoclavibacter sp. VKM Ac-2888]